MRAAFAIGVLSLVTATPSSAQPAIELDEPRTKLEAFALQVGAVIVRGFSKIGEVAGPDGSVIIVESRELMNATTGSREHGIAVRVVQGGQAVRDLTAYVDFDEIPSLIQAMDYMARIEPSSTPLDHLRAVYRTRGELAVSTFSTGGGMRVAVSSGVFERTRAHLELTDLKPLKELVESAYRTLEELRRERHAALREPSLHSSVSSVNGALGRVP